MIEQKKVFVASVHGEFEDDSYFNIVAVFKSKTTAMNQLNRKWDNPTKNLQNLLCDSIPNSACQISIAKMELSDSLI